MPFSMAVNSSNSHRIAQVLQKGYYSTHMIASNRAHRELSNDIRISSKKFITTSH